MIAQIKTKVNLTRCKNEIELLSKYKVNYFNDEARKSNITMKEQEMKETQSKYEKSK